MIAFVVVAMTLLAKVVLAVTIGFVGYRILWPGLKKLGRVAKRTVVKIIGVFRKKKKTPDEEVGEIEARELARISRLSRYRNWEEFKRDLRNPDVSDDDILIKCGGKLPKDLPSLEVLATRKRARNFLAERDHKWNESFFGDIGNPPGTIVTYKGKAVKRFEARRQIGYGESLYPKVVVDMENVKKLWQKRWLGLDPISIEVGKSPVKGVNPVVTLTEKTRRELKSGDWARIVDAPDLVKLVSVSAGSSGKVWNCTWDNGITSAVLESRLKPAFPQDGEWWHKRNECPQSRSYYTFWPKQGLKITAKWLKSCDPSLLRDWIVCGCLVPINFGNGNEPIVDPISTPTIAVKDSIPRNASAGHKYKPGVWVRHKCDGELFQISHAKPVEGDDAWNLIASDRTTWDRESSFELAVPLDGEYWRRDGSEICNHLRGTRTDAVRWTSNSHVDGLYLVNRPDYVLDRVKCGCIVPVNFGKGEKVAHAV